MTIGYNRNTLLVVALVSAMFGSGLATLCSMSFRATSVRAEVNTTSHAVVRLKAEGFKEDAYKMAARVEKEGVTVVEVSLWGDANNSVVVHKGIVIESQKDLARTFLHVTNLHEDWNEFALLRAGDHPRFVAQSEKRDRWTDKPFDPANYLWVSAGASDGGWLHIEDYKPNK